MGAACVGPAPAEPASPPASWGRLPGRPPAAQATAAAGGAAAQGDAELAARFSQATCELQFVGVVRPAKRRRGGDFVQRAMHMPAPATY